MGELESLAEHNAKRFSVESGIPSKMYSSVLVHRHVTSRLVSRRESSIRHLHMIQFHIQFVLFIN